MDLNPAKEWHSLPISLVCAMLLFIGHPSLAQNSPSMTGQIAPITKKDDINILTRYGNASVLNVAQQSSLQQVNVCDTWTFKLKIGNASSIEKVTDIVQLPNHDYILVGTTDAGSGEQGLMVKMDKESNVLWSKSISLPGSHLFINKIKHFSDGKLYMMCEVKDIGTGTHAPIYRLHLLQTTMAKMMILNHCYLVKSYYISSLFIIVGDS